MKNYLNKDMFEKYFFYGLQNKNEVLKWIIVGGAKKLSQKHKEEGFKYSKDGYELDKKAILELIVQLERFTTLHDDPNNRKYIYDIINTDTISINQMFNKIIPIIEKTYAISIVEYEDFSGIFFTTQRIFRRNTKNV